MPYKDPEKQKAAQKAWYDKNKNLTYERSKQTREKRKEIIREIKESSPCVDCNISYPYYVMHFDHLDSKTKIDKISNLVQVAGIKIALDEINKCDLLCANCHSIRTWKRQHGLML
jgi:hypothetical protein